METQHKKVLVIDDEQDLREALATALSYEGFEVLTAADGNEGAKIALHEKPDLIFLDVMMPKIDGMEALRRIREDAWGQTVPVVVMTALDDMEKIAEAVEKGATEYVTKSTVSLGVLVDKAKEYLHIEPVAD